MPQLQEPTGPYYAELAWVSRYMLDWGHCGAHITRIRAYTTIIRWFTDIPTRQAMWAHSRLFAWPEDPPLGWQHKLNLDDLLGHSTEIPVNADRQKLGLFFASLFDGDLVTGGPTPDWIPQSFITWRPGFAYLLGKWYVHFQERSPYWPWWIFPTPEELGEL